jgi:hypothetical protein
MRNKYNLIFINLVLSIGLSIYFWIFDGFKLGEYISKEDADIRVALIGIAIYLAVLVWVYSTLKYWKKCVELDDPVFTSPDKSELNLESDSTSDQNIEGSEKG